MGKKEYTHAKGFNVTSLEGVVGIYIFIETCGDIAYIGKCDNDFKNRIRTHTNKTNGKLDNHIQYILVIKVDPSIHQLHVLENLFIWCLCPPRNNDLWIFCGDDTEREVKATAKKHNIHIRGTLKEFLLSFDTAFLEREWDENFEFKKYGEIEQFSSKRKKCDGYLNCLCYKCLINNRLQELYGCE